MLRRVDVEKVDVDDWEMRAAPCDSRLLAAVRFLQRSCGRFEVRSCLINTCGIMQKKAREENGTLTHLRVCSMTGKAPKS